MSENNSPYWTWVKCHGNIEPIQNNAENLIDPDTGSPRAETHKGQSFTAWLAYRFEKLTERQKQVFDLSFRKRLSNFEVCRRLGISAPRLSDIQNRLREIISENVEGLK